MGKKLIIIGIILMGMLSIISGCIEQEDKPFGTINSITHTPTIPDIGETVSFAVEFTNTGTITGDIWIKAYQNGVYQETRTMGSLPPDLTYYTTFVGTVTAYSETWVFECGHNDETSYDTTMSHTL